MKTVKQVQAEIHAIEQQLESWRAVRKPTEFDRKEVKRAADKLTQLRQYMKYLETDPREDFLMQQRDILVKRLRAIDKAAHEYAAQGGGQTERAHKHCRPNSDVRTGQATLRSKLMR